MQFRFFAYFFFVVVVVSFLNFNQLIVFTCDEKPDGAWSTCYRQKKGGFGLMDKK